MRFAFSKRAYSVVILLLMLSSTVLVQALISEGFEDIQGTRGNREVRVSRRIVRRSQRLYARNFEERRVRVRKRRSNNRERVRKAPPQTRIVRALPRPASPRPASPRSGKRVSPPQSPAKSPKTSGKTPLKPPLKPGSRNKPPQTPATPEPDEPSDEPATEPATEPEPPATTIVEVPQQNLTLAFVNPKGQALPGLRLVAHVQPQQGEGVVVNDLVTNDKGQVRLEKIALPAAIDLDLGPEQAPSTAGENAEKVQEWEFANAEAASLLVLEPLGARVGTQVTRLNTPLRLAGLRLAGLRLPRLAAGNVLHRAVIYEGAPPEPITVERTVVDLDIAAPAGSKVTTAALSEGDLQVPASGHLACRLSLAELQEGPIPIRVAGSLPGGEVEAIINDYPLDPYGRNEVASPQPRLVRLAGLEMPNKTGVLASQAEVLRDFGNPLEKADKSDKKSKATLGSVKALGDGSQWWIYPQQGIGFKLRPLPAGKTGRKAGKNPDASIVERIRVFRPAGGTAGGISAQSSVEEVRQNLGAPQAENAARPDASDALSATGSIATYLDGGLRICEADGKVQWLDIMRPTPLLTAGTTAFAPRSPARLFVESFNGNARSGLEDVRDLVRYLGQVNSVRLVDSREDAELVLSARAEFREDKQEVTNLIPFKYQCATRLSYSLFDTSENRFLVKDKQVEGKADANYTKEAIAVGITGGVLIKKGGLLGKILGGAMIGGGIVQLHQAMKKAANRAPAIAARTAFNFLVADLNNAADFNVRVSRIDYGADRLLLNAGAADGVRPGHEFQVSIANTTLPHQESSRTANYYTAVVLTADQDSSVCELRHVNRKVQKFKENFDVKPDLAMLQRIPDPATGLISARAWVNFPDITVISDDDVAGALKKIKTAPPGEQSEGQAEPQQAEPQENQPENEDEDEE